MYHLVYEDKNVTEYVEAVTFIVQKLQEVS